MQTMGLGRVSSRFTGEVTTRGALAYTTTWGRRDLGPFGNQINIWDISGDAPRLIDTTIVAGTVSTTGDVAVTDDGRYLVVALEFIPGGIAIFDLANPTKPVEISRFANADTRPGVHTATVGRVDGRQYAFLAVDNSGSIPARLIIVDITTPTAPREVHSVAIGQPFMHDTFLRDGILFLGLWNQGMQIWDLGGGGAGGTPSSPKVLGTVATVGGEVHNIWWFHDPSNGSKCYAFVGEEGPGSIGSTSSGDVHVVDVTDMTKPREVAFYRVDGAGTHNFSADEARGILYVAYYNAGVRALDVRGDLGSCTAAQKSSDGRCDLKLMGRELGTGLAEISSGKFIWGVEYRDGFVYASDMLNGIWKIRGIVR
jgi:hypothetical protein